VEITDDDVARATRPLTVPPELERLPLLVHCLRDRVQQALLEGGVRSCEPSSAELRLEPGRRNDRRTPRG
jgi:hypothetical protein